MGFIIIAIKLRNKLPLNNSFLFSIPFIQGKLKENRNERDTQAAKAFFKWLVRKHGQPRALVTDKYAATLKAVRELQEEGVFSKELDHRTAKVLNNILEQDHRLIKKRVPKSCGLQSMRTAKGRGAKFLKHGKMEEISRIEV